MKTENQQEDNNKNQSDSTKNSMKLFEGKLHEIGENVGKVGANFTSEDSSDMTDKVSVNSDEKSRSVADTTTTTKDGVEDTNSKKKTDEQPKKEGDSSGLMGGDDKKIVPPTPKNDAKTIQEGGGNQEETTVVQDPVVQTDTSKDITDSSKIGKDSSGTKDGKSEDDKKKSDTTDLTNTNTTTTTTTETGGMGGGDMGAGTKEKTPAKDRDVIAREYVGEVLGIKKEETQDTTTTTKDSGGMGGDNKTTTPSSDPMAVNTTVQNSENNSGTADPKTVVKKEGEDSSEKDKKKTNTNSGEGGTGESGNNVSDKKDEKTETPVPKKEKTPEEVENEEGKKEGLLVGRSMGMGEVVEIDNSGTKPETGTNTTDIKTDPNKKEETTKTPPATIYKRTSFLKYFTDKGINVTTENPNIIDPVKFEKAKGDYLKEKHAAAQAKTPNYYSGYISGYNIGYQEGKRYKAEEEKAAQDKKQKERTTKPEYVLGLEIGKYAAMLTIQNKTNFELQTVSGAKYNADLNAVKTNANKGKTPDGKNPLEKQDENAIADPNLTDAPVTALTEEEQNYKDAFLIGYNSTYQEITAAKSKQPTHQDKLADPDFRRGYEMGNKLGRNKDLTPEQKTELEAKKFEYTGKYGATKAAEPGQELYAKERSGFIYGYNSAYYQLQSEAQAKAKALKEKKEKDPVYKLGKAAGTIKGILASVFGEAGIPDALADPEKIKKAGISIVIPEEIKTIITENSVEKSSLLVKPNEAQDPAQKAELETKKQEQLAFFKEAYQRTFLEGYQKGQKDKQTFEQNKYKNDPDYQAALRPIMEVTVGSKESSKGGEIKLKLNPGAAKAYAEHKLKTMSDNDTDRTHWTNILAHTTKLRDLPTEEEVVDGQGNKKIVKTERSAAYKKGYDECYSYFVSKLNDPEDPINIAITSKLAFDRYGGETESEKQYYAYGVALANEKIKAKEEIEAKKSKEERDTLTREMEDKYYKAQITIKAKLANEITKSKIPTNPPVFKEDTSLNDLENEVTKMGSEAAASIAVTIIAGGTPSIPYAAEKVSAAKSIRDAWRFFINGYNGVIYKKLSEGVKVDNVNDAAELAKKQEALDKKYGGKEVFTEKEISEPILTKLKLKITEKQVAETYRKYKNDAIKLYQQGSALGYKQAYTNFTTKGEGGKPHGAGANIKSVSIDKVLPFEKFKSDITQKEQDLINENKNKEDKDETKIKLTETKAIDAYAKGLLYFYITGYNFSGVLNDNANFGAEKGLRHGQSFVEGYNDAEFKKTGGSQDAYKAGQSAKISVQGYEDFKTSMKESAARGGDKVAAQELEQGILANSDHYNKGKKDDADVWKVLVKLNKNPDETKLEDYEQPILKKKLTFLNNRPDQITSNTENEKTTILDVNAANANIIISQKDEFIKKAVNYYYFKLRGDEFNALASEKGKKPENLSKEEREQLMAKVITTIKPYADDYEKGYTEKLANVEAQALQETIGKLFYAHGYKDGFMRVCSKKPIPKEIEIVEEVVTQEGGEKSKPEINKADPQYIQGNLDGAELGRKLELGIIEDKDLSKEISRKRSKKKNGATQEADNSNDYVKGQNEGKQEGENAAKSKNSNTLIPNPEQLKLDKIKEEEEQALIKEQQEKKAEEEQAKNAKLQAKTKTQEEIDAEIKAKEEKEKQREDEKKRREERKKKPLSDLYKEGFRKGFWEKKDAKSGEIDGIQSVVDGSYQKSDFKIQNYYVPIGENEDEKSLGIDSKQRAIKDSNVYENNFINAQEAAKINEDPAKLLKGVKQNKAAEDKKKKADLEKMDNTQRKEKRKAIFIKEQNLKIKSLAKKMAEKYGNYKAYKETSSTKEIDKEGKVTKRDGMLDKIFALQQQQGNESASGETAKKSLAEKITKLEGDIVTIVANIKGMKEEEKKANPEKLQGLWKQKLDTENEKTRLEGQIQEMDSSVSYMSEVLKKQEKYIEQFKVGDDKDDTKLMTPEEAENLFNELLGQMGVVNGNRTLLDEKLNKWTGAIEKDEDSDEELESMSDYADIEVEKPKVTDPPVIKNDNPMGGGTTTTTTSGGEMLAGENPQKAEFTLADFSPEEKTSLYKTYDEVFNSKKDEFYYAALAKMTESSLFNDETGDILGAYGNNDFSTKEGTVSVEDDAKVIADIQDALDKAETDDGLDIVLSKMPIVSDLYGLEELMKSVNQTIPENQKKIVKSTDEDIIGWEQKLLVAKKEKSDTEDVKGKIDALLLKQNENTITPEEQTELANLIAKQQNFEDLVLQDAKIFDIEEKIKDLQVTNSNARQSVDADVEKIRQYLIGNLKLSLPDKKKTNELILDYVNYFDKKLLLKGGLGYSKSPLSLSGTDKQFLMHENAEDVRIDADIRIQKGEYVFIAKGLEYIENKEHINLFQGKAFIPRLEGDLSASNRGKYSFEDIGLSLKTSVRTQLKYQQNKLMGGELLHSTGTRDNRTVDDLKKDEKQNINPK